MERTESLIASLRHCTRFPVSPAIKIPVLILNQSRSCWDYHETDKLKKYFGGLGAKAERIPSIFFFTLSPSIFDAALSACRRLNDFASTVRILEEIYPYAIQELRPTLNELGISTPEELSLDKV
ncbi:unnamed protein product [Nyctereutes procyonoides]|uniref:Cytochrome c oxidase subunit 5A, mitochondrial n=1 Tax=Nyctereutes procyonoides TaxID=34880 RepID=A0A811ZXP1_NYCPR|nr:unnamed protein product [Nyctereutes procyonoides]